MTTSTIPHDAKIGDKPGSVYVVQLPWPYADAEGEWRDRREGLFECSPLGLAAARKLVAELLGPGQSWPAVRIIKRTEEVIG